MFSWRGFGIPANFWLFVFTETLISPFCPLFFFYQQASNGAPPWYMPLLRCGVIRFCSFSSHSSSFPIHKISSWFSIFSHSEWNQFLSDFICIPTSSVLLLPALIYIPSVSTPSLLKSPWGVGSRYNFAGWNVYFPTDR